MKKILEVKIDFEPVFFSLYTDGDHIIKTQTKTDTEFYYKSNAVLFLYYTYPTHRRVYCIKNTSEGSLINLPNLNKPVEMLFKQIASRVDKTRRAVSFLKEHYKEKAFSFPPVFYRQLDVLILKKGKLDYPSLDKIAQKY